MTIGRSKEELRAWKIGDEISKKKLKEVFSMTDIGRMIREDGIEEGIEKVSDLGKYF